MHSYVWCDSTTDTTLSSLANSLLSIWGKIQISLWFYFFECTKNIYDVFGYIFQWEATYLWNIPITLQKQSFILLFQVCIYFHLACNYLSNFFQKKQMLKSVSILEWKVMWSHCVQISCARWWRWKKKRWNAWGICSLIKFIL